MDGYPSDKPFGDVTAKNVVVDIDAHTPMPKTPTPAPRTQTQDKENSPTKQHPMKQSSIIADDDVMIADTKSGQTGSIVGAVFGVLIVIVLVLLVIFFIMKKRNVKEAENDSVFVDSEMETNDCFSSTNDTNDNQDDPLWGTTEMNPAWTKELW